MKQGLQLWWKKNKHFLVIAGVIIILITFTLTAYKIGWGWAGFASYTSPPHSKDTDFQRAKTLWDWMQLLIIPVILAIAALLFNFATSHAEQKNTQQRYENDQKIAADNQCEDLLQNYLDRMSELLLNCHLRTSDLDAEARYIARARTLTVLYRLDPKRKRSLLQFLQESNLINIKEGSIIRLEGADLREAYLRGANLSESDLRKTDLRGANLSFANLREADLRKANLLDADLHSADMREARLNDAFYTEKQLDTVMFKPTTID